MQNKDDTFIFFYLFIKLQKLCLKWSRSDSETANVSARHAALKRWTLTDNRWNKNVVSLGSDVTSVKRLPICAKNSWMLTLMGPSVSSATRKKSWVPLSELYLFLFLTAAVSAALALEMALCCR